MEDTQLPAWAVVTGNLSSLPAAFEDADVNTKGGRLPHTGARRAPGGSATFTWGGPSDRGTR